MTSVLARGGRPDTVLTNPLASVNMCLRTTNYMSVYQQSINAFQETKWTVGAKHSAWQTSGPPRQKSRVERLKAKVEPLLT